MGNRRRYQFGGYGIRDQSAGSTLGGGRKLADHGWNPSSGSITIGRPAGPADSVHGTFNLSVPAGPQVPGLDGPCGAAEHRDWNFQLTLTPRPTLEFVLWWHFFHLQQARDALYDARGIVIRQDPTGAAGRDVNEPT